MHLLCVVLFKTEILNSTLVEVAEKLSVKEPTQSHCQGRVLSLAEGPGNSSSCFYHLPPGLLLVLFY